MEISIKCSFIGILFPSVFPTSLIDGDSHKDEFSDAIVLSNIQSTLSGFASNWNSDLKCWTSHSSEASIDLETAFCLLKSIEDQDDKIHQNLHDLQMEFRDKIPTMSELRAVIKALMDASSQSNLVVDKVICRFSEQQLRFMRLEIEFFMLVLSKFCWRTNSLDSHVDKPIAGRKLSADGVLTTVTIGDSHHRKMLYEIRKDMRVYKKFKAVLKYLVEQLIAYNDALNSEQPTQQSSKSTTVQYILLFLLDLQIFVQQEILDYHQFLCKSATKISDFTERCNTLKVAISMLTDSIVMFTEFLNITYNLLHCKDVRVKSKDVNKKLRTIYPVIRDMYEIFCNYKSQFDKLLDYLKSLSNGPEDDGLKHREFNETCTNLLNRDAVIEKSISKLNDYLNLVAEF